MSNKRLQVGDACPDAVVLDADGNRVNLASLWQSGPTLLNFLRHFGCIFCREWLSEVDEHHTDLKAAGLQLVSVAIGEPKHAARYCPKLAPNQLCLATPTLDVHKSFHMDRVRSGNFNIWKMLRSGLRAASKGHMQGKATTTVEGTRMLGGSLIVDKSGVIRYIRYNNFAGDNADFSELLAAAARLA